MPTQIFQYFVPVGSTSVSITAAFFGAGGVTLDVETTQQAVGGVWPTSVWRIQAGQTFADGTGSIYSFSDYSAVTREPFNTPTYQPTIVSKPKNAAEVVDVLNYCDSNNIAFKVRSGTHSYAGESIGTGVIIDMKLLNGATLDAANEWIDVEGGALQWQPNAALEFQVATSGASSEYGETGETQYNNVRVGAANNPPGYWTPVGSCVYVGWSSITTGGGISIYPNRVGLMCDLILEADIIVGKSGGGFELVTATPTNTHADLLDGIRGIGNSTLGIITRLRSKVFPRKQAFNTRVGLSWRPGNNTDFKPTDANLWGITAGSTAGGWTAAHTSDQWKFGKHLYETYQDTLMGGETYAGGHTLAGKPIWPHGITNGIDGTFYMWGNVKHPDRGWDDYSITYHFVLDSFQGEQGLIAGIPEHQYFLAQTIIDRTIAKDSSRYERFRTGTKNGSPVDTIRLQTTRATADQGINQGWDPSESGILAQGTQTSGISDLTYALNGSLAIPNNSTGDADVAGYNFDFYRDIITNINPGITYAGDTGASQGIYYRWYTHSTTPDGPIAIPPHGISHNIQKDTLGWRDRPNEIQMFDQAYGGGGVTYSDLFYTSATGPNDGKLTPLGEQLQTRRVTWFNQMISSYGGNDPRSYIGYLDPLVNKYTTPNGSALDINRFYYGPTGVNNINALKAIYDPNSKFPTGPVIKDIDLITPITPAGSISTLRTLILNTPAGDTLNLNGGVYTLMGTTQAASIGVSADFDNGALEFNGLNIEQSITIENGTVAFYELHQPTAVGDGTFTVPNTTNEKLVQMFDPDSSQELIRLATYPPQYDNRVSTFFVDTDSFKLNGKRGTTCSGCPVVDLPISNAYDFNGHLTTNLIDGSYYTSGFTVTGATLVNNIKSMLDGVSAAESAYSGRTAAATGIGLVLNINPNALNTQTVLEYSEGLSGSDPILGITFAGGTYEWPRRGNDDQYINEFNFFGRVSFGTTGASNTYYTYGNDEIIYKPLSGSCSNLYLPHISTQPYSGFVLKGGVTDITMSNLTVIGAGDMSTTHAGKIFYDVRGQWGPHAKLSLRNFTSYMGSTIYTCNDGCWFDAEDSRFIGQATSGIGGAAEDRYTINRCEFKGGLYKNSAIAKTNAQNFSGLTAMGQTKVTNCVFNFDSNHGQAISAYAGSWINTEITGNIFMNVPRPVSLQWSTQLDSSLINDLSSYGGYTFTNNLIYLDHIPAQDGGGQSGLAYNGENPETIALELQDLLPGSPTGDGFYGLTAGVGANFNTAKTSSYKYAVQLVDNELPRVKLRLQSMGYRVRGGTGYILSYIDRWDLVDGQENWLTSRYDIDGRSGPSGSNYNGALNIFIFASGPTAGDSYINGITCTNTLMVENIPPITLENNTIMLSRDIIQNEGINTKYVYNNAALSFGGGSSRLRRNVNSAGPMVFRNNIIYATSQLNSTRRAGKTGGYDITTGATLDIGANGVYEPNEDVVSLYEGENVVENNVFFTYIWNAEGFVDGYRAGTDPPRKNVLSKSLGSTLDASYSNTSVPGNGTQMGGSSDQVAAWDRVFTWNGGTGTIEPNIGYRDGGITWSAYPKWEDVKNLGYTFSSVYSPTV